MICLCENYSVVDTEIVFSGVDFTILGDEIDVVTIKDTCCCNDCGSIFYSVYETYSEVD